MRKHFKKKILPIIKRNHYRTILEIGVASGKTTIKILKYCRKINGRAIGIDPAPSFEPPENLLKYWSFHKDLSLKVLQNLSEFDCVIVDGDHNWYTVYNELCWIEKKINPQGTIFLHDVAPPWARRDMYYSLETIPEEYRNPCEKHETGIWIARHEGGSRNGVLTAVEDFCRENPKWIMTILTAHHGLGVLQPNTCLQRKRRIRYWFNRSVSSETREHK